MYASKNIAMLMRVKYLYCNENLLLLVNLYVRILDITFTLQDNADFPCLFKEPLFPKLAAILLPIRG